MYIVRVKFVNGDGRLSPKTYNYNYFNELEPEYKERYYRILTTTGDSYRDSKIVIIEAIRTEKYDVTLKTIDTLTYAGNLSPEHATALNIKSKNALTISGTTLSGATLYIENKNASTISGITSYIDTINYLEKEKDSMFENIMSKFQFGRISNTQVKMSMNGIAFKDKDHGWVAFDNEGSAIDVTGLVFDLPLMYCMLVAVKDVQIGDYIRHNDYWVKVMDENERGNLVCLNPWNHEEAVVMPVKLPFGFDFVTKLMCFAEDMFQGSDASAHLPFGSMLPLMLMMDKEPNSNSMLLLMLMMQNNNNKKMFDNSMMLMLLMSDKNDSKNDLMLPLMYSMMVKTGNENNIVTEAKEFTV